LLQVQLIKRCDAARQTAHRGARALERKHFQCVLRLNARCRALESRPALYHDSPCTCIYTQTTGIALTAQAPVMEWYKCGGAAQHSGRPAGGAGCAMK